MNIKNLKLTLIITCSLLSASAMAGFDITRMTTVVDDFSGSYTVTRSGRLENMNFSGNTLTEFNQFHPGTNDNNAALTGVISKTITRGGGQLNTSADGEFTVSTDDNSHAVSFTGLEVFADADGVVLSGTVTVNGTDYDAADLPEVLAGLLRRVFWLTRR
ncbi:hypothetical protein ACFODZ_02435 [Marinicella sediminis]|uniref:Uncharacterized protein n=1 Tax=Marinicella sediminis TaxID=1792834 RepID=A0ABV7J888_9GAMM|nr:hypothetical protein [Marinicella sediminis]